MDQAQIGPYRVVRQLGEGGMGRVLEAVHTQIERRAAIKVLHKTYAQNPDLAARFLNEARSVNLIRHPGIVEVIDFGQLDDGAPYLVMEFLEGESLFERMARLSQAGSLLPTDDALRIGRQIALAVAAAHDKGVIHRDLKPENVMLVPDPSAGHGAERVKVLDFGIAKLQFERLPSEETMPGLSMGTPEYMAPEQHSSAASVSDRADVFSLGAMLYEMLSGRRPFRSPHGALAGDPPPLGQLRPQLPEDVKLLVMQMLAREPASRPPMAGVAAALRPAPPPRRRQLVRLGLALAAASAVLVVLGTLGYRRLFSRDGGDGTDLAALRQQALAVLLAELRDPDRSLRLGALAALGPTRDGRLVPEIAPLLRDSDGHVVAQAAEALGQLGERKAQGALLGLLKDTGRPEVVVAAAAALDQLGDPRGGEVLRQAMKGRLEAQRLRAALLLCGKGDEEAREILKAEALRGGLPEDVVVTILVRLAQAGDGPAREALLTRMHSQQAGDMRLSVAGSLARLGEDAGRSALRDAARRPGVEQLLAARLLAAVGEWDFSDKLREVLADHRYPIAARVLAAEGLAEEGRLEDARLLQALLPRGKEEPRMRLAAAAAILQLAGSDPRALTEHSLGWARVALGDESWTVREAAAGVLGEAGGDEAVALLSRILREDREARVRRGAARALGRSGDARAVGALLPGVDDADQGVRMEAMSALSRVGQTLRRPGPDGKGKDGPEGKEREGWKAAQRRLSQMLQPGGKVSRHEQVLLRAALLHMGDEGQRRELKDGLSSPDPEVRRLVVEQADLDGEVLLRALSDRALRVRWTAARKLAERGDRRAAPVLRGALLLGGAEGLLAYGLLRRLGYPVRLPPEARELLAGPDVNLRLQVVEAVSLMPPREAVPLLWRAAYDPEGAVRRMVTEVAADLPAAPGSRSAPGVPVLRLLRADPDAAVRSRAQLLLSRFQQPGAVLLAAPEPPLLAEPVAPPSAAEIEALVREGVQSFRRGEWAAARLRFERAHALCVQGRFDCQALGYDLRYLLGRVYAAEGQDVDLESLGAGASAGGGGRGGEAAAERGPRPSQKDRTPPRPAGPSGRVRISQLVAGRCRVEERTLPVGKQVLDVSGRRVPVQVRENDVVIVDACR